MKKLYRSRNDRILAGVCGGLGEYLGVDSTVVRLLWAISIPFSWGTTILAYLVAALIIPEEPKKKPTKKKRPVKKSKKKAKKK